MTTTEDFRSTWLELLRQGGSRQRLVEDHTLHLYFGSDVASRPVLILIADRQPELPQLSAAVSVDRGQRADSKWSLVLTLQDRGLRDTFIGLCVELVTRSRRGETAPESLEEFFHALAEWRSLLAGAKRTVSEDQLRGLVAEMAFGLDSLIPKIGPSLALSSWRGPYGSPQDFLLPDGSLCEVKSIRTGGRSVEISSPDQLDPTTDGDLTLAVVTVDDSTRQSPNAVNLLQLFDSWRNELQTTSLIAELNHRLEALGVELADEWFSEHFYRVGKPKLYGVTSEFPRLQRTAIPLAIQSVSYTLRLAAIASFQIEPHED